jgi:hypothetical protein
MIGMVFFIYVYSVINIRRSEVYVIAKNYIKENNEIEARLGKVTGFGDFPYGGIGTENNIKKAQINLKIIGEKAETDAQINLEKENSTSEWKVINLYILD